MITSDDLFYRVKQSDRMQTFPHPPSPTRTNLTCGINFLFVGRFVAKFGLLGACKLIHKRRQGKLGGAVRKGQELQEVAHIASSSRPQRRQAKNNTFLPLAILLPQC